MCYPNTLNMDAASCSYMSALHVHTVSYPKRLQSTFTSITVRNSKSHYCIFCSSYLCFHGLVLWEETTSFYFNIRGACLMCLYNLLSSSGSHTIKSWISNKLPCKTEKSVHVTLFVDSLMWRNWTHFDVSQIQRSLDLYKTMSSITATARVCSCNGHAK